MSPRVLFNLFKVVLAGNTTWKFLIGVMLSLGFSITVVICSIGLMDGFETSLKTALSRSSGDILIKKKSGYFLEKEVLTTIDEADFIAASSVLELQAMAITEGDSVGVLLKGVQTEDFNKVSGLGIDKLSGEIAIGDKLAQRLDLSVGDELTIAIPTNSARSSGAASFESLKIKQIISHQIYEKDLRFIYLSKDSLTNILNLMEGTTSKLMIKLPSSASIKDKTKTMKGSLGASYSVTPFWEEFSVLLDAVKVEKFSITLVLQLLVIVALLNIAAFIIYTFEKKSLDFFMLRAMGLGIRYLQLFWFLLLSLVWFGSCALSLIGVLACNLLLKYAPFFQIPGDIYVLSKLKVILDGQDYIIAFGSTLVWMLIIGMLTLLKLRKSSLATQLKEGFA